MVLRIAVAASAPSREDGNRNTASCQVRLADTSLLLSGRANERQESPIDNAAPAYASVQKLFSVVVSLHKSLRPKQIQPRLGGGFAFSLCIGTFCCRKNFRSGSDDSDGNGGRDRCHRLPE